MKKILLSVLALLALAGTGTAQTLPSYVPANGLVGWWPFNGNANDESGNNNVLTSFGPVLTMDRFGIANSAYLFDSTQYFLKNSPVSSGDNFSISLWFYKKSTNGGDLWHETSTNSTTGGDITCNNGLLQFICQGINMNVTNSTFTPALSTWTNVTLTKSGNQFTFYINGVLNSTGSSPYSAYNSTTYFALGNGGLASGSSGINGKIDDIAIYNRALTQQEITALYQGTNTTGNCPTFPASLAQGLVGYWPFCGNANDESGNSHDGTIYGGVALRTDRFGQPNSAFQFNGIDGFIEIANSNNMNYPLGYSLSGWVNFTTNQSDNPLLTKHFQAIQNGYILGIWDNRARFYSSSVQIVSPNPINDGNWHHLVAVYNDNTMRLFLDNIAQGSIIQPFISNNYNVNIGKANGCCNFNGSIDDIAIWNRALTPQEITQLYNQGICQTSITVTDTLLIHTGLTAYNPVAYGNTLKVWPNPTNTAITLDAGNLSSMQGWKYKVANTLGQTVVNETAINQQQTNISLSTWGGNGIYYLHLINPQGHAIEIKKIVLAP